MYRDDYKTICNSLCEAIKEKSDKAAVVNTRDEFVSTSQIQILKSILFWIVCTYIYTMTFSLQVDHLPPSYHYIILKLGIDYLSI